MSVMVEPTVSDVDAAADRIRGLVVRTPLLESDRLNDRVGARILVKAECLQRAGSFKFRGACNRLLTMSQQERANGAVAWSSGNHALALAAVSATLGVPATIIMPNDAPRAKIDGARAYGATIRLYDRRNDDREAIGNRLAAESGATIVPPYDDPLIIAGQGTVGRELMEQAAEIGVVPDAVLASASGGGLIAGVATAVTARSASTRVYCAEPSGFDDHARSLAAGAPVRNRPEGTSICDALQVPTPGRVTFPINRSLLAGGLVVTDEQVRDAMRAAFDTLRVVVEPGGAAALAAVLAGQLDVPADGTAAVVLSGGNVDHALFASVLD